MQASRWEHTVPASRSARDSLSSPNKPQVKQPAPGWGPSQASLCGSWVCHQIKRATQFRNNCAKEKKNSSLYSSGVQSSVSAGANGFNLHVLKNIRYVSTSSSLVGRFLWRCRNHRFPLKELNICFENHTHIHRGFFQMLKSLDWRISSRLLIKRGLNMPCPWCANLAISFLKFQC